jgi:chromosome condensin MukBEF ATPase and DNA-binding subunit MukB
MDDKASEKRIEELERELSETKSELALYRRALELQRIGNRAVRAAQEENRRLGIPNVFSRNGRIYYELPNGEITQKSPFKEEPED